MVAFCIYIPVLYIYFRFCISSHSAICISFHQAGNDINMHRLRIVAQHATAHQQEPISCSCGSSFCSCASSSRPAARPQLQSFLIPNPVDHAPPATPNPQDLVHPSVKDSVRKESAAPSAALSILKAGNKRYLTGSLKKKGCSEPEHRAKLAKGQSPPIAVLGCADSRCPPELVFDADAGEIFTVRVAGNVVDPDVLASLEYACKHLGTKAVVRIICGEEEGRL